MKITIPSTDWKPGRQVVKAKPCSVGVAGDKAACAQAKVVISSIAKYHHHEVTHPGLIHKEVDVPPEYLNFVIGTKGAEIKHIKVRPSVSDVFGPFWAVWTHWRSTLGRATSALTCTCLMPTLLATTLSLSGRRGSATRLSSTLLT